MHDIDEDNILSQLVTAWFNLAVVSVSVILAVSLTMVHYIGPSVTICCS